MGGAMTWQIKAALAAVIAALAFSAGWVANGWRQGKTIADMRTEQAEDAATRADAARIEETKTAGLEAKHATGTIYNADALAALKTDIERVYAADSADAKRVRDDSESRAATYRAQANANTAAASNLANHAAALDRSIADGRIVVTRLKSDLAKRDAEVKTLCDQLDTERALNEAPATACSQ